jgi:chromosome segregation ATPase
MEQMSVAEKFFRTASDLQQLFKDRENEHALDVEFFNARIEEKVKEVEELEDQLAQKSREVFELENGTAVSEFKLKVDEMGAELSEKDNIIAELRRKLNDLELIEQVQDHQILLKDAEIAELKSKVSTSNEKVEALVVEFCGLEHAYDEQKKKTMSKEEEVKAKESELSRVSELLTQQTRLVQQYKQLLDIRDGTKSSQASLGIGDNDAVVM